MCKIHLFLYNNTTYLHSAQSALFLKTILALNMKMNVLKRRRKTKHKQAWKRDREGHRHRV